MIKKKIPNLITRIIQTGLTVLFSVLLISSIIKAGSLTPTASPAPTMYTLEDIYTRLDTNDTATEGGHAFTPAGAPAGTFHTLKQIYEKIPTIDPTKVVSGTTYLGVAGSASAGYTYGDNNAGYVLGTATGAGTALVNLWNGTSGAFTGGSQANGGADDYNNAGSAPANTYSGGWTVCNSGNSYCGTGDSGADVKDNTTGLVWSKPCNGDGCTSFSDSAPLAYSWDNSGVFNSSKTAYALCTGRGSWALPHQKQLMQAYIDGSYNNLEAVADNYAFWSASTRSYGTTYAWYIYLSHGLTYLDLKTAAYRIRCVR